MISADRLFVFFFNVFKQLKFRIVNEIPLRVQTYSANYVIYRRNRNFEAQTKCNILDIKK